MFNGFEVIVWVIRICWIIWIIFMNHWMNVDILIHFICICWPSVSVNRRRWESTESRLAGALVEESAGEHWGKRFGPNKASRTTKPCFFVWVMLSVEQTRIGLLFSIWNKDQTREWLGVEHSPFFSAGWVELIEFDFGIIKLWGIKQAWSSWSFWGISSISFKNSGIVWVGTVGTISWTPEICWRWETLSNKPKVYQDSIWRWTIW